LDIRALVLCGLAICTNSPGRLDTAVENFNRARAITSAPGVVKRVLRLYDEMKRTDSSNVLGEAVRIAATGETQ
jgi:hypothetical protein